MSQKIHGHKENCEALERLLLTERLPTTLLFHGREGIGKRLVAQEFAQKLAQPEDIRTYAPEAKSGYLIETIKRILHEAMETPYNSDRRVFILDNAHKMLPQHANALLKTLEEPLPTTHFILITDDLNKLLPTICSRSFVFKFHPLTSAQIQETLDCSPAIANLSQGSLGSAGRLLQNDLYSRFLSWVMAPDYLGKKEAIATFIEEELEEILTLYQLWVRDLNLLKLKGEEKHLHFEVSLIAPYKNLPFPSLERCSKQVQEIQNARLYNVKWQSLLDLLLLNA